jgi:hypothetical protein
MNSGNTPRPVPAIRAGIMASPLFTRSGPDGRTVADFPFLCVPPTYADFARIIIAVIAGLVVGLFTRCHLSRSRSLLAMQ